jgi:hypothetical protein
MDNTRKYSEILKEVLLYYSQFRPSHGNIRVDLIFDEERDHYALVHAGWNQGRRVHAMIFYATLHDGKVYLEHDGINYGISDDLIERGIPEADIVLTWMQEPLPDREKDTLHASVSH